MCGDAISEYVGTGVDRDEKYKKYFCKGKYALAKLNFLIIQWIFIKKYVSTVVVVLAVRQEIPWNFILSVLSVTLSFLEEREKM